MKRFYIYKQTYIIKLFIITHRSSNGLTIHISASEEQFLAQADEGGFMKRTKSGIMRNFNTSCIDDFLLTGEVIYMVIYLARQICIKCLFSTINHPKVPANHLLAPLNIIFKTINLQTTYWNINL